jgi:hypothetical protein
VRAALEHAADRADAAAAAQHREEEQVFALAQAVVNESDGGSSISASASDSSLSSNSEQSDEKRTRPPLPPLIGDGGVGTGVAEDDPKAHLNYPVFTPVASDPAPTAFGGNSQAQRRNRRKRASKS